METMQSSDPVAGTMRELTGFQQTILTVLAEKPMYGLAVKRALEDYYAESINHGRLYPNLDELVELGLVDKTALDKRTNQYALTDEGYGTILAQLSWMFDTMVTTEERAEQLHGRIDAALDRRDA